MRQSTQATFGPFLFSLALAVTPEARLCAQSYSFTTLAGQAPSLGYADGPAATAKFNAPSGMAKDPAGNLYVAESQNGVIRKISPAGNVSTFASGIAYAMACDSLGNVYAADSESVRRITPTGGDTTLTAEDGSALKFNRPTGLALDPQVNVYLIDSRGWAIQKITPAGAVSVFAGAPQSSGTSDGFGGAALFIELRAIACDPLGNLYVVDRFRIRKITLAGAVSTIAGGTDAGSADGPAAAARFSYPDGLTVDGGGNVYVADTANHAIRKIAAAGVVSTLAGTAGAAGGDDGSGAAANFDHPAGLVSDSANNLYVADSGNHAIRQITPAGVVSTFAGALSFGQSDGTGGLAHFRRPKRVALDAAGNLYVTDMLNHTVRKITQAGVVTTVAGSAHLAGVVDGTGSNARLDSPVGIVSDTGGNFFVSGGPAIRRITAAGAVSTFATIAGSGLAADASGNLYLATSDSIQKITPAGIVTTFASRTGTEAFVSAYDMVLDEAGALFFTDPSATVQKFMLSGVISTLAGARAQTGGRDGVGTDSRFSKPAGIALDAAGNLFVTDTTSSVIRKISPKGDVTTIAGQPDVSGSADGVGGHARFRGPSDIAVDAAGVLYVVDSANNAIRKGTPVASPSPPIITNGDFLETQGRSLGAHGATTFAVIASGTAPLNYQWFRNGVALAGATSATLTLTDVSAADEGFYSATITNAAGTATLRAGNLTIYTPPLSSFSVRNTRAGGSYLWGIATDGAQLIAVGTGGKILASTDGRTWTPRNSGTTEWLVGIAFGAGKFAAVGDHGVVLVSTDGIAWTPAASSGTTQRLNNVTYGAGKFVAVGEAGTIVTSSNATNWTLRSAGTTGWLRGVAYNSAANYFCATGQAGTFLLSSDGVAWFSDQTVRATVDLEAAVAIQSYGHFAGIGQSGVAVGMDQITYYSKGGGAPERFFLGYTSSTGSTARLRGLAIGANALFATGENGVVLGAPMPAGPWSLIPTGTTANLVAGAFLGNSLYVVGENETILQSEPLYGSRLINISTRGQVGTGANAMISGFVVNGPTPKQILLRAAGPALANFGLAGALAPPVLTLFDGAGKELANNTRWGTAPNPAEIAAAIPRVGAFAFATGSADSALLLSLTPGSYTAQVSGQNNTTGLALIEAYDADPLSNENSRAINISTRGQVGAGANQLIAGFVITGTAARRVLIRAAGPSLVSFGLTGVLTEPKLELYHAHGYVQATAGAWSDRPDADEIRGAAQLAGAFPFLEGGRDAAIVTTLLPGAWTVQVSSANATTGLALVEVYDLP